MLLQIFADWPAPAPPQWTMRLPIVSRIGLAAAKASASPPHMKVSVAPFAPPTPPETGASTEMRPAPRGKLMRLAGAFDVDRRAVDEQRAVLRGADDLAPDRQNMLAGRQHRDDDVRALHRLGRTFRLDDPARRRRRAQLGGEIEACDRVAGLDEIGGHRAAHVAETDECDGCHVPLSPVVPTVIPAKAGIQCVMLSPRQLAAVLLKPMSPTTLDPRFRGR